MLDILEIHLKTAASPELSDLITQACRWFEEYELPGYQDEYTDLLMSSDNADAGDLNVQLVELTLSLQQRILSQMLIEISTECTVRQASALLEGLKSVEHCEFSDEIIDLCGLADTDGALCEILSLVTGEAAEYFYPLITNVDKSVLKRIKEVVQANSPTDVSVARDPAQDRLVVDKLLQFEKASETHLLIKDMIIAGTPLHLPFTNYYESIFEQIAALNPQQKAVQLYAASIVSSDAAHNPRSVVSVQLNKTYTSADEITPIMVAFETIVLKFHAQVSSGVTRV